MLPALPFAFIWVSSAVARGSLSSVRVIAGALVVWAITSSLWTYPHCMSYVNELAGGTQNGHLSLLGSEVDWGQDVWYLKTWCTQHPEAPRFISWATTPCRRICWALKAAVSLQGRLAGKHIGVPMACLEAFSDRDGMQ